MAPSGCSRDSTVEHTQLSTSLQEPAWWVTVHITGALWEHLFGTSQGSPYARFRRALDSRNATVAFAPATELEFVSLPDALELLLLLLESEPSRFERAARRWHGRYCREVSDVDIVEAQAVLACLAGLRGSRPEPPAHALADLVHRRDLARASEVLNRWGATRATRSRI
jgi:hypothetical protein